MKCPHCQTEFFDNWYLTNVGVASAARLDFDGELAPLDPKARSTTCPACEKPTFEFYIEHKQKTNQCFSARIFPRGGSFPAPPHEVPNAIAQDYSEANEVLTISPKASAALSRRCLQGVLASQGYTGRDLVKQVEAVLNETDTSRSLPTALKECVDAIRNFGNFSAHPITDQTTLQIVDVEEGEAEWCLQLLLDLFDHFYVAPARAAEKRALLAAKLAAAGKPPMKS